MIIDPQLQFNAWQSLLLLAGLGLMAYAWTQDNTTDKDAFQSVPGLLWDRRRHHSAYVPSDRRGIANSTLAYHAQPFSDQVLFDRWGRGPHWWPNR